MNAEDKTRFVNELVGGIAASVLANVSKMPENWDGHELRALLAAKFAAEVSSTMQDKRSGRFKNYVNDVIVLNL